MAGDGADNLAPVRNFRERKGGTARWVAAFEKAGDGRGAGRLDKDAFVGREPALRGQNLLVGHDIDPSPGILYGASRRFPTGRVPDPDGRRDCLRILHDAAVED